NLPGSGSGTGGPSLQKRSIRRETRPKSPHTMIARALALACAALVMAGCGRKATEAAFSFLPDPNPEGALKRMNITDPTAIAKRKDEIRGEFKESLKDCVGKRVTDGMLACVGTAQTADEIDRCMR